MRLNTNQKKKAREEFKQASGEEEPSLQERVSKSHWVLSVAEVIGTVEQMQEQVLKKTRRSTPPTYRQH